MFINLNSQDYALEAGRYPQLNDARVLLDLRARHSDKLHSYGFYNYGHSSQGESRLGGPGSLGRLSYWPLTGLEANFGVRGNSNETRQFSAARRASMAPSLRAAAACRHRPDQLAMARVTTTARSRRWPRNQRTRRARHPEPVSAMSLSRVLTPSLAARW